MVVGAGVRRRQALRAFPRRAVRPARQLVSCFRALPTRSRQSRSDPAGRARARARQEAADPRRHRRCRCRRPPACPSREQRAARSRSRHRRASLLPRARAAREEARSRLQEALLQEQPLPPDRIRTNRPLHPRPARPLPARAHRGPGGFRIRPAEARRRSRAPRFRTAAQSRGSPATPCRTPESPPGSPPPLPCSPAALLLRAESRWGRCGSRRAECRRGSGPRASRSREALPLQRRRRRPLRPSRTRAALRLRAGRTSAWSIPRPVGVLRAWSCLPMERLRVPPRSVPAARPSRSFRARLRRRPRRSPSALRPRWPRELLLAAPHALRPERLQTMRAPPRAALRPYPTAHRRLVLWRRLLQPRSAVPTRARQDRPALHPGSPRLRVDLRWMPTHPALPLIRRQDLLRVPPPMLLQAPPLERREIHPQLLPPPRLSALRRALRLRALVRPTLQLRRPCREWHRPAALLPGPPRRQKPPPPHFRRSKPR